MASLAPTISSRAQTAHEKTPASTLIRGHRSSEAAPADKMNTSLQSTLGSKTNSRYQRFVLPDPVAFSYLEEDESVTVLDRGRVLEGYQCYIVEQWACSRSHPTYCIAAYTGDASHSIKVGVLSVPADENTWSPRLRVYFQALIRYHARRRETPIGTLMVTNLSGFPTALTIVYVPDGDLRKNREDFVVNENLKRLGCSGRVGLTLSEPNSATQAKFLQLYRTSDKVSFYSSVIELVKLCQVALLLFGRLEPEYADGLLCDITEKAITDWWVDIGTDLYNIEPNDGILGPTTVAALLGTLMGARNRLNTTGAPVGKDVFDVESTKRAIAYFQKNQRISKSRRLDRRTVDRLHRATAKQASGDSWIVPRAVKYTVAELSGKGGEMVMEMVGKDRANISEVETVDIERFTQLVKGERAKWLWWGTPRKRTTRDLFADEPSNERLDLQTEKNADTAWLGQQNDATGEIMRPRRAPQQQRPTKTPPISRRDSEGAEDMRQRRKVFDRAKGRLKGAVVRRAPEPSKSKDGSVFDDEDKSVESLEHFDTAEDVSPIDPRMSEDVFADARDGDMVDHDDPTAERNPIFARSLTETPTDSTANLRDQIPSSSRDQRSLDAPIQISAEQSRAQSIADATDLGSAVPVDHRPGQDVSRLLRRSRSYTKYESDSRRPQRHPGYWPRHLSFSLAEEAILSSRDDLYPSISHDAAPLSSGVDNPAASLDAMLLCADAAKSLRASIAALGAGEGAWAIAALDDVEALGVTAAQDAEQLSTYYQPRKEQQAQLARSTTSVLHAERGRLRDAVKDVDGAKAKLEYEITGMRAKVEDVERAVAEFERKVLFAEGRVDELVREGSKEASKGWMGWFGKFFWGSAGTEEALRSAVMTSTEPYGREDFGQSQ